MKCPKCGYQNSDSVVSCNLCSAPFTAANPPILSPAPEPTPATTPAPTVAPPPKPKTALQVEAETVTMADSAISTIAPPVVAVVVAFLGTIGFGALIGAESIILGAIPVVLGVAAVVKLIFHLVSGYQKPIFYLIAASLVGSALGLYIFVTFMVVPEPILIRGQKPSCAEPEPKSAPDTIEPTAYRNETIGFSINPPKGWHAIASSSTFKAELNEADSPRMEIRRYQMGGGSADAVSELAITAVAEGLPIIDHQILEKKAVMVGDKNASRTVAGIWIQDKGLVKVMIVIIDYGDAQWVITGRSWNIDYPRYRNTFFTSIQTFKAF